MPVKGGAKLADHLRKQLETSPVHKVTVGVFSESRYPDGTPVASVAVFQEYGTDGHTPRRPTRATVKSVFTWAARLTYDRT